MANAGKAKGGNPKEAQHGEMPAGKAQPGEYLDEFDISDELKGDNALAGRDQRRAPSERHAQAGATGETDGLLESFEKTAKHDRAKPQEAKREGASEAEKRGGGMP